MLSAVESLAEDCAYCEPSVSPVCEIVSKKTLDVANSFVLHEMIADEDEGLAEILEIVGGVVSPPEPPGVVSKVGLLVRVRLRPFPDESAPLSLSKVYLTKKVPVGASAPGKFPLLKASAPCCQHHQSTCASDKPTP